MTETDGRDGEDADDQGGERDERAEVGDRAVDGLRVEVVEDAEPVEHLAPDADHTGGQHQPGRRERGVPEPAGLEPGDHAFAAGVGLVLLGGRCQRADRVQQPCPELTGQAGGEPVEVEATLAGRAGADPDRAQPEQPVDRGGGQVDGPHPVERGGDGMAADQAALELDPLVGDPEPGGPVAHQPDQDRDRDPQQLELHRPVGGGAGDEQADQHRQELDQLRDGVDQQHPGVEPLPVDHGRRGRPLRRRYGWARGRGERLARVTVVRSLLDRVLAHVASPGTASARRASRSTSSRASVLSRAAISSAPAADAVVTVTEASPNIRLKAPSA